MTRNPVTRRVKETGVGQSVQLKLCNVHCARYRTPITDRTDRGTLENSLGPMKAAEEVFAASTPFVPPSPKTAVTNSFSSLPRFRIYSCYVALSSRNYVPRQLNSRQLLARSSLISLEIKDDNVDDDATGETQYQREERDTNLTISTGTKTIPNVPGRDSSNGTFWQLGPTDSLLQRRRQRYRGLQT